MKIGRTNVLRQAGMLLGTLALAGSLALPGVSVAQDRVSIEVVEPGAPATPIGNSELVDPATGTSTIATFAAPEWTGGTLIADASTYGRPAAALYAQDTGSGTASFDIQLSNIPTADVTLYLVGMDDDQPGPTPIELTINTTVVYTGDSWFADWNGKAGEGDWTTVRITIPRDMLGGGVNSITVSNMSPTGKAGESPFILLGAAQMIVPGVAVGPIAST